MLFQSVVIRANYPEGQQHGNITKTHHKELLQDLMAKKISSNISFIILLTSLSAFLIAYSKSTIPLDLNKPIR